MMTDNCTRPQRKTNPDDPPRELWVVDLGMVEYQEALALQKRLQWAGRTMVTMPLRVRDA